MCLNLIRLFTLNKALELTVNFKEVSVWDNVQISTLGETVIWGDLHHLEAHVQQFN